jgi:hypothetical protein
VVDSFSLAILGDALILLFRSLIISDTLNDNQEDHLSPNIEDVSRAKVGWMVQSLYLPVNYCI